RFISNQSSGKMGYAVADAAAEAGARVTLVSGPTSLDAPFGVARICVTSAKEMLDAVMQRIRDSQIFIGAAAVSDYAPKDYAEQKLKKSRDSISIALVKTRDILADVAALDNAPFTVGFAAETNDVETYAKEKLSRKLLDMIAANRVGVPGSGFGSDDNTLTVYWSDGAERLELAPKLQIARRLIGIVADRYREKHSAQNP
ncbi:MAG: bifunctional 4'-phosphopantothenoylcysteine decarboxylase/phosphopantothenoylcysteine synthetase, partial [Gammaproteobacteria bacterium]|nr:bifunctional 4'-phosphopantothenoylcysteine decarboxylase/phosphopantothenoylcysteine synthetase [Gammaproteobacteria bacterium]